MRKTILISALIIHSAVAMTQKVIDIDYSISTGQVKEMLSGNKGGEIITAEPFIHSTGINSIRLHDYHESGGDYYYYSDFWNKNVDGTAIDINTSFDPLNPSHYNWDSTDNLVQQILDNNFSIYFRIGTSFPNSDYILQPQDPPSNTGGMSNDFSKFAQLSKKTVDHYNNGWDNGYNYNIEYWEIWNEPGGYFWDGSVIQFYKMYQAVSDSIKSSNPNVKVGSLGAVPATTLGLNPAFKEDFISYCNLNNVELDFYSWHIYGLENPYGLKLLSDEIRDILDDNNFTETESHISEFNYKLVEGLDLFINSSKGAAYYLSLMITAQESHIDKMIIYPSVSIIRTSINSTTYTMTESANALMAFDMLKVNTPIIVQSTGNEVITDDITDTTSNFMVLAGKDVLDAKLNVLISNFASNNNEYQLNISNLPWINTYPTKITKNVITTTDNFTETSDYMSIGDSIFMVSNVDDPSVVLLRFEPDLTIGISNDERSNQVKIYPNPTSGKLNIDTKLKINSVTIFDVLGKEVQSCNKRNKKIDISMLPKGIYTIQLLTETGLISQKIVKE